MAAGNVTLAGNVSGLPTGAVTFGPLVINLTAPVSEVLPVALTSGANTITVPAGATVAIISPPNATVPTPNPPNASVLTLKGVTGDTGIAIHTTWPTLLAIPSTVASFVINSSVSANITVWFA